MQGISLNKFVADSGYCSRREADNLITQNRVTVNDMLGTLSMRVLPTDIVAVDFEIIKNHNPADDVVLAYHKPAGLTCTTDLEDRSSIMHFIKYQKRIFPIGRLDKDSQGLLLLTNNGDIVNKILRSGNNHEKEYWVTLAKPYTKDFLKQMGNGVQIDAGITKPCKVKSISPRKFSIILTQGLNRQIRKMCKALDAKVTELQRVRIMNIYIGQMAPGKFRKLNDVEYNTLLSSVKDSKKTADKKVKVEYIPKSKSKNFNKTESKFTDNKKEVTKKEVLLTSKKETKDAPKKGSYKAFKANKKNN